MRLHLRICARLPWKAFSFTAAHSVPSFLWALFSFTITDCNNEASIHMLTHASGPADKQKWQRCFFLEKLFVIVIFPTLMKFD